jgi:hypothetical protein
VGRTGVGFGMAEGVLRNCGQRDRSEGAGVHVEVDAFRLPLVAFGDPDYAGSPVVSGLRFV